jgi:hypothetical protein
MARWSALNHCRCGPRSCIVSSTNANQPLLILRHLHCQPLQSLATNEDHRSASEISYGDAWQLGMPSPANALSRTNIPNTRTRRVGHFESHHVPIEVRGHSNCLHSCDAGSLDSPWRLHQDECGPRRSPEDARFQFDSPCTSVRQIDGLSLSIGRCTHPPLRPMVIDISKVVSIEYSILAAAHDEPPSRRPNLNEHSAQMRCRMCS